MRMRRLHRGKDVSIFMLWFLLFIENLDRLYHIIIKNFKIIIRSKSSALVVIFGPLVVMILIGIAFNNSAITGVNVAVSSANYGPLSEQIIKDLQTENYIVTKITNGTGCIDSVKRGDSNICLLMSPGMTKEGKNNTISFYVDSSRINIVYEIMNNINHKLGETSQNISLDITQNSLDQIQITKRELTGKNAVLDEITKNNLDANAKVTTAVSSTSNLNLSTSLKILGYEEVRLYWDDVQGYIVEHNLSVSGATKLNQSMKTFESNLRNHITNITAAQAKITGTTDGLQSLATTLGKEKAAIETIKSSVNKINQGLNGINTSDASSIVTPINTNVQTVVPEGTHLGKLFPSFLTLLIMFVCILLGATLVLNEKSTNAHFRNFITPTNDLIFLIGTYLTSLIIVFLQTLVIFVAIGYFLSFGSMGAILVSIYPMLLIASVFIFIGIALGYLFNSYETSMLAALFVISASMVLSNTILPSESIPVALKSVLMTNPFILGESAFRGLMLFGLHLSEISLVLLKLWIYIPVTLIIAYLCMKLYKKRMRK